MDLPIAIAVAVIFLILTLVFYSKYNTESTLSTSLRNQVEKLETIIKEKDAIIRQKEAQVLKSSIDPHFFKNSLQNLRTKAKEVIFEVDKIKEKSKETVTAIEILSDVLKYIIYDTKKDFVLLKDEVEFIKQYLELQKLRNISSEFEIHIDTDVLKASLFNEKLLIAPLITIDFIENAFKYTNTKIKGFIHIKFELIGNTLFFSVRNSINQNVKKSDGGFGLDNLRKRLKLLYNDKYQLEVISKKEHEIFTANLKLELHEKQD